MASLKSGAVLGTIGHLFERGTCLGATDAQLLERFASGRDETAFEALVVRHGRSVRAVCLHVLRDPHDAEDAFQATFVILARKAGSLWVGDTLAGWLHRVARRVAVEANRQKARRQAVEQTGIEIDVIASDTRARRDLLVQLLHEEIDRLPEKYRTPIILCDLEELTRDEAAGRLGWPPGTVAGRLARARALLRDRLSRRGHPETAGLALIDGMKRLTSGGLPSAWIRRAVRLVTASRSGVMGTSNVAPCAGATLATGVLRTMMMASLKRMTLFSIVGVLATTACVLAVATAPKARPEGDPPPESAKERTVSVSAKLPVSGTVALPDGRPASGTRLFYSTRDHAGDPGHLRAEAVADAEGRFSLVIPPVDGPWPGLIGAGTLWAYRPGSFVATIPVYRGALRPGSALRIGVGPTAGALFEVHHPDGRPVVGAKVSPRLLDRHIAEVPDRLADLIGFETLTDSRGRAVVAAFSQEEIRSIEVQAEGYGRQVFMFGHGEINPDPKVVRLRPVGRLKGRLVGDPAVIRRCPLSVCGFSPSEDPVRYSYSEDIVTDDEGRFEIPAIAVGPHGVKTPGRCDSPWYVRSERGRELVEVKAGETTEVVLTMERAVRVRGVVRESGTEQPIAGVRMAVAIDETGAMTTGRDGIYEGFMEPGATYVIPRAVPPGHAMPLYRTPRVRVPGGVEEFVLPPFELMRAGEVRGKVVDNHSRPAVGAEVEASWNVDLRERGPYPQRLMVRTGPEGRFVIPGVAENSVVTLTARQGNLHSPGPRTTAVKEAVILHLTESSGVALAGLVLDPAGRPIGGASVHLRARQRAFLQGVPNGDELVVFEGGAMLVADASGRFRTPDELDQGVEYAAYVSAPGFLTSRTQWTRGNAGEFPVIRLRPVP